MFSRWDFTPRSSASITNTGPRVTPPPTQGPTLWHRRSGRDTCQGPLVPSDATAAGSCQAREVTARPQLKCRLRDDRLQSDAPSSRKPSVLTAMMWRGWGAGGGLSLADRTQAEDQGGESDPPCPGDPCVGDRCFQALQAWRKVYKDCLSVWEFIIKLLRFSTKF